MSLEEFALAAELAASLKVNAKDAAKAAKVLAREDLGLISVDQLGTLEKAHIDLAAAGLSVNGKKALLKRYEELAGGGSIASVSLNFAPPKITQGPRKNRF